MKLFRKLAPFFALMLVATTVYAASPWTTKTTYKDKALGKLDFGFKNLFGGWTEIFSEPYDSYKNHKNIFAGIGLGFVNAVWDTVGGALHIVTAPFPQIDLPLPQDGVSLE